MTKKNNNPLEKIMKKKNFDKSDFWIYYKDTYFHIVEGDGTNLDGEDDDVVDYMIVDVFYQLPEDLDAWDDSGMILFTAEEGMYCYMDAKKIIAKAIEFFMREKDPDYSNIEVFVDQDALYKFVMKEIVDEADYQEEYFRKVTLEVNGDLDVGKDAFFENLNNIVSIYGFSFALGDKLIGKVEKTIIKHYTAKGWNFSK